MAEEPEKIAPAAHPVDHWKAKFTELASQLDEIEGKAAAKPKENDRDATQDRLAAKESAMNVKIESKKGLSFSEESLLIVRNLPPSRREGRIKERPVL